MRRRVLVSVLVASIAGSAVAATVPIVRDRWGVPHVFVPPAVGERSAQLHALGVALGYAQAQDRMFQLELARRNARGRNAELAAPFFAGVSALPADIAHRRDGLTDAERRTAVRRLPRRLRLLLEGHTEGINRYLDEVRADPARAPLEFDVIPPVEPWDVTDTAAVAEGFRYGYEFGGAEIFNAVRLLDLLERHPASEAQDIFDDVFWLEDPTAPTTIDPAEQVRRPPALTRFAAPQMALLAAHAGAVRRAAAQLQVEFAAGYGAAAPTSNAIAVAGTRTASGAPILLGGPQSGLTLPSTWWQVGLHGGGYAAELLLAPSMMAIGRTATAAWTVTSTITDTQDTYVEALNPANPRQYRFRGRYRDMECRTELFRVAGETAPRTEELCRTVHGPVLASFPEDGVAFARRSYTAGRELRGALALLALGFAQDQRDVTRQLDRLGISLNVLYADADGTIAYFVRGVLPLRSARFDPRLPLPGSGEAEPRGVLTGRRLPSSVNPASGLLVQWNNKPVRGWSSGELRELWGGVDRVQVLHNGVEAARRAGRLLTTDDVTGLMRTAATTDFFAPRVAPYLRAAVEALPATTPDRDRLAAAVALVDAWLAAGGTLVADGSGTIPYPGLTIYRAWRSQMQVDTFADELGAAVRPMRYFQHSPAGNNQDDHGLLFSPDALLLRALDGAAAAFALSRDYFRDVAIGTNPGRDAVLVGALRTVLDGLATRFGTVDMLRWLTPRLTVQFLSRSAAETVYGPMIVERQNRGSVNLVVELTPEPAGQVIVPPGNAAFIPSTFVEPPHLRDQLAPYAAFDLRPMPFALADLEGPTTTEPVAVP